MKFSLRQYAERDFESLYEIDQLCYTPAIAYSRRELRTYLRFPGSHCIVARAARKAAGFIITLQRNAESYIVTIDVLPEFRRHALGTALLKRAERKAATNGATEMWLETATNNSAAIAFWQKHGYRSYGVIKNYYPGNLDAYSMAKSIGSGKSSHL